MISDTIDTTENIEIKNNVTSEKLTMGDKPQNSYVLRQQGLTKKTYFT